MRNKSKFTPHDRPTNHDEAIADDSALLRDSDEESGDSSDKAKFVDWLLKQKWWVVLIFVCIAIIVGLITVYL